MKKIIVLLLTLCFAASAISACGTSGGDKNNSSSTEKTEVTEKNANVASDSEKAAPQELDTNGLTPVYGKDIKDGKYDIKVDSSSPMFNVTKCELTVENGKMTAVMTMGGKGYLYIFMGKGENATDESSFIPFVENEQGEHTFTVPLDALNTVVDCAAFSKNKEKWYDRQLLFRADTISTESFNSGVIKTAETLGIADGEYTVEATLEGGSGKVKVKSPTTLTVKDKKAYAVIEWSSPNYDYMIVDGERFDGKNTEDSSVFEIPVIGFDYKMPVKANTTAMSTPHEIEYTLYINSSTIK